jgi:hypothetical protein
MADRTSFRRTRRGLPALLAVGSILSMAMRTTGAEDTGTTTQHIASVDGGVEAAIDAPWRLEPDPLSALRYPKIPIVVSIHDASQQYDPDTQVFLGTFCEMAIQEAPDQGPPMATQFRTAATLTEIERNDIWPPNSDIAPNHRRCRPASGQACPADLEVGPAGEWHGTVLYTPTNQTPGTDVHLTVQVRIARTGRTCGPPKNIVLDYPPFDRFREHPYDPNSYVVVNRLNVHLAEQPLPRFDEGWVYGDLHYHSQGTDNEGESAYAYRPTLQAMRAMGLDFLFATEHASDSVQTTDIDEVYLRNIDVPDWIPYDSEIEDFIESIPIALETNANAARDMSPQRFGFLLGELNGPMGGNAEVMQFPGRGGAPRIFLGGEVDVIPEMSDTERTFGWIGYGNGRQYGWRTACTPDGFSLLATLKHYTSTMLCDNPSKLAGPTSEGGRFVVKDLQGLSDSYHARQHMVHLPTDPSRFDAFVSSSTELYGGATRRLGPATAAPGQEGVLQSVLYRDYAVEDKGYFFLAHPVDAESGKGIGRLGPDIVPYSDVQLKTAMSSPSFLGLQLWNEDTRLRSSTAYSASLPGFPLQIFDGATSPLSRWLWRRWLGPQPNSAYAALHDGQVAWDRMNLWGMRPSQTAGLSWLPAGEPRRVFMAGGSDAHGDWNYRREGRLGGVSAIVDTAIGKPRNLVYVGPERPETVYGPPPVAHGFLEGGVGAAAYGAVGQQQVTSALAGGNFAVTDGPAVRIAIDANSNFVIDDGDVLMGSSTTTPYRGAYVPLIVEWKSTPEFGPVAAIDLYLGVANEALDDGLVYAAPHHGVHSASTPGGGVSPDAYIDANGIAHQELLDGYMLDPTGRLHFALGVPSMEGRRHMSVRINDFPTGRRRVVKEDPVCTSEPKCPVGDITCWHCTTPPPPEFHFDGVSLPDRAFVRAFVRTAPPAGTVCGQDGQDAAIAMERGRCIERLAFTNPIWVDNKVDAPPPGDFTVSCSPTTVNMGASSTCTVRSLQGFNKPVSFGCSGLPSGAACSFQPSSVTPPANGTASTTLRVSAVLSPPGSYGFTVSARNGFNWKSLRLTLNVGGGSGNAVFDKELLAPRCDDAAAGSCDTGSLVRGRAVPGREPNASNTLSGSCEDGPVFPSTGTVTAVDRIVVATAGRDPFTPGIGVKIGATIVASSDPSSDAVDFYYAADARQPEWTLVDTVVPDAPGPQELYTGYRLPAGAVQAVRVQHRTQGTPADPCAPGDLNDRDDVVFAVRDRSF